jgi:anti-sigma B factor antagonist
LEVVVEIVRHEKGAVSALYVSGRMDLAGGTMLKEQVKKMIASGTTSIHLNLTNVEFINSSGLGSLVSTMKEVRLAKGRLTLSNLASYVQEIFDITQLSHIFEIFKTEEEALNSYRSMAAV